MVDCSDKECHDNVTRMETCLKSKISGVKLYSILGGLLIIIASILSPFIRSGMDSFAENKKNIKVNEKDNAVVQERIKTIKSDIAKINKNIEKMKEEQLTKKDFRELVDTIKEVVKNNKE